MTAPTTIEPLSSEYARYLSMSKRELFEESGSADRMMQVGGAYVGPQIEVPTPDESLAGAIETFVVDASGDCAPTGSNRAVIDHFSAASNVVAGLVIDALHETGVTLGSVGHLTASINAVSDVSRLAHFDDDLYAPDDGVGCFAILGTSAGPRIACADVPISPVRSGLPLEVDPSVIDGFWSADVVKQVAAPNRLVVMPQFGQLHAGPGAALDEEIGFRTLFVFRAETVPTRSLRGELQVPRGRRPTPAGVRRPRAGSRVDRG